MVEISPQLSYVYKYFVYIYIFLLCIVFIILFVLSITGFEPGLCTILFVCPCLLYSRIITGRHVIFRLYIFLCEAGFLYICKPARQAGTASNRGGKICYIKQKYRYIYIQNIYT